MRSDTIVAVATPAGVGGIAVVRLSGPDAYTIATKHLSLHSPLSTLRSPLSTLRSPLSTLHSHHATYCCFDDLDDIVATWYPRGYSGEPTVEFSCHGSRYVQQALVEALVADGARLAEPGEFTLRAFLNGRLNLAQAEAVADLIDAVTPAQHRLAVSQLRGGYAQKLKELRQQLVDLTSLLELELDFSQEDVEFADRTQLRQLLSTLHSSLSTLISSFALGNALKQGIPVAIVGAPNVGKSTLLNALLDDDRAIVSDIPGTTRDTVEGMLTIDGVTFRLIDTAGLRETTDAVEQLGIERSRRACEEALIVLDVIDNPNSPLSTLHSPLSTLHSPLSTLRPHHILVLNKCDLHSLLSTLHSPNTEHRTINVSAKTGEGLDELKAALLEAVGDRVDDDTLLSNARHRDALLRVQEALRHADEGLAGGLAADLVAVDLRDALYHLGTVTGDVTSDQLLANIFSRFCVGK